jgi:predicted signal transduction protein with EAL and GGDEF domain
MSGETDSTPELLLRENTELKQKNAVLESRLREMDRLLTVNPFTGLSVRRVFDRVMEQMLTEALESGRRSGLAVGLLRLDHDYSRIKDHRDRNRVLLYKTAERLQEVVGPHVYQSDRIDEFLIVLPEMPNVDGLELRAEELISAVSQSHEPPADDVHFGCFLGLSLFPAHGETKEKLLGNADIALKESERALRPYVIYDDTTGERFRLRERIEVELKQSIHDRFHGFSLNYQPFVDPTRQSRGAEALLRWVSPTLGSVSPAEFVPIAEETGIIRHLGHWALYQACRQLRQWHKAGYRDLYLSVNLSPAQFNQADLVERVAGVIESTGLEGSALHLELTETTVMGDPEDAIVKLDALREIGIRLALDDFGTGYSSLTHLRQFPFDVLKIDRSFVTDVDRTENNREIVSAMIDLAHAFGMHSLAEGVEREEEFSFLVDRGVQLFQGFLFSRPLDSDAYAVRLADGAKEMLSRS